MMIFLSTIQEEESKDFEKYFITKPSKHMTDFWRFPYSENTVKILKNVRKNDWFLFAYDGKYRLAAQVKDCEIVPSYVNFKNVTEINRGFVKTNNEFGISSSMPSVHRIPLLEVNDSKIQQIIKNWHILRIFKINSLFIRVYSQHSYMNNNKGDNL